MKIVTLLALGASAAAFAQSTVADREAGGRIFRTHCAPCHGVAGKGGAGPDLTTGNFIHGSTDGDLYRNISEGIPGTAMPDVFFDGAQVWQIVAYVKSLNQQTARVALKGDPARGRQLVAEKGCIGCHLIRGDGGDRGPDLSVIGSQRAPDNLRGSIVNPSANIAERYRVARVSVRDDQSYTGFLLNQDTYSVQLQDFAKGLVSLPRSAIKELSIDTASVMPSYSNLSSAELDDIVSYLASLRRDNGVTK